MRAVLILALIFAVCATAIALPASSRAEDDSQTRLARGDILISTRTMAGSDLPEVTAQAVLPAAPEKVWRIIEDCGNYKRTMQRVAASKELERKGNRVVCEVTIDLPFPLSDLTGVTEAVHVVGPPKWSRTWHLLRGDYEKNEGSWTLTTFAGDANRTLAVYKLHAIPNSAVPAALIRKGQRDSLPKLIEHLREIVK